MISADLIGDDLALMRLGVVPPAANVGVKRAIDKFGADLRQRVERRRHGNRLLKGSSGSRASNIDFRADWSASLDLRSNLLRRRKAFARPIGEGIVVLRRQSRPTDFSERAYRHPPIDDVSAAVGAEMAAALRRVI